MRKNCKSPLFCKALNVFLCGESCGIRIQIVGCQCTEHETATVKKARFFTQCSKAESGKTHVVRICLCFNLFGNCQIGTPRFPNDSIYFRAFRDSKMLIWLIYLCLGSRVDSAPPNSALFAIRRLTRRSSGQRSAQLCLSAVPDYN